ncbi:MAG: zinc ribbon domain-containing protein [Varibaculum sp.]|nr:zinc ribbon domain-containing protein [Varibaculum sp.]
MASCSQCGAEVAADAAICSSCGAAQPGRPWQVYEQQAQVFHQQAASYQQQSQALQQQAQAWAATNPQQAQVFQQQAQAYWQYSQAAAQNAQGMQQYSQQLRQYQEAESHQGDSAVDTGVEPTPERHPTEVEHLSEPNPVAVPQSPAAPQPAAAEQNLQLSQPTNTVSQQLNPTAIPADPAAVPQNLTVNVMQTATRPKNSIGTAGFVLAIVAIFTSWIPFLGVIVWILGTMFSLVGLSKKPRGLAIAGSVISLIGIVLLILLFTVLAGTFGLAGIMSS